MDVTCQIAIHHEIVSQMPYMDRSMAKAHNGLREFSSGVPAASDLEREANRLCDKLQLKHSEQNADLVMQSMVLRAALPQVTVLKGFEFCGR